MRVVGLWRHPVKSLQGERLDEAVVEPSGLAGDREWGIRDEATGTILTGRREPPLLLAAARLIDGGEPQITLPGGRVLTGTGSGTDGALSAWLGRPVRLVRATDVDAGVAEYFEDATDDDSRALTFTMPHGRFVDALPLLLATTASLRQGAQLHPGGTWDARRFRPNLLIDVEGTGWVEDGWCGRRVGVGDAVLEARQRCERCTMVTRAQPDLERDVDVYRTLARQHAGTFGVWASVLVPGPVRVDDPVTVDGPQR